MGTQLTFIALERSGCYNPFSFMNFEESQHEREGNFFRKAFERENLAYLAGQADQVHRIIEDASTKALEQGRLGYHEFFQGELSFIENNFSNAVAHYDTALKHDPDNSLFLSNKATVKNILGEHAESVALFKRALTINPTEHHALVGLVAALTDSRQLEEARKLLRKIRISDLSLAHQVSLLESLVDLDDEQFALRIADDFLRAFPNSWFCHSIKDIIFYKRIAERSAEYKLRPYLKALITCDSVKFVEGKPHCEGIFDFVNLLCFPGVAPTTTIYLSFLARRIKTHIKVVVREQNGPTLAQATSRAYVPDLRGSTHFVCQLKDLVIPKPGVYVVEAYLDGRRFGRTPLIVNRVEPRPDFTEAQIAELLKDPEVVKSVRGEFKCPQCGMQYLMQMNLDTRAPIDPKAMPFPEDDNFNCRQCGKEIGIAAVKTQLRQLLGSRRQNNPEKDALS